jgi:hypothetical protein
MIFKLNLTGKLVLRKQLKMPTIGAFEFTIQKSFYGFIGNPHHFLQAWNCQELSLADLLPLLRFFLLLDNGNDYVHILIMSKIWNFIIQKI